MITCLIKIWMYHVSLELLTDGFQILLGLSHQKVCFPSSTFCLETNSCFQGGYTHRAMGDIECSLMLMKWCKANLLIPEDIPKQAPQSILENPKEVKK